MLAHFYHIPLRNTALPGAAHKGTDDGIGTKNISLGSQLSDHRIVGGGDSVERAFVYLQRLLVLRGDTVVCLVVNHHRTRIVQVHRLS